MINKEQIADLNPAKLRTIEKFQDGIWITCRMKDLKVDNTFRFQDRIENIYIAQGLPFVNDFYVWTIDARIEVDK